MNLILLIVGVDLSTPVNQLIVMLERNYIIVQTAKQVFSKQADRTNSDHVPCHQTNKMHCRVCGQVYHFSCFKISNDSLQRCLQINLNPFTKLL